MSYYLIDDIYLKYETLIPNIANQTKANEILFAKIQEATQKNIEWVSGVLKLDVTSLKDPIAFSTKEISIRLQKYVSFFIIWL